MSVPLIETRHLKKYFPTPAGQLHAVDDVNITIQRGQTLGVVGESGCGKSTMGRTILRLLEATGGEVLYNGEDILKYSRRSMMEMRKKMQIIFQDPYSSLNPRMTVADIIAEPMKVCRTYPDAKQVYQRVDQLMDTVGLARRFVNAYPHELDGGRRQRIGIARALALNPEFIVCDEPVSALDVSIQAQILKCVERAPVDAIFSSPMHPYTQALLSAVPKPSLKARGSLQNIIKGEVSNPINPKPGCRFASRCPRACERCTRQDLKLEEHSPGHFVACALIEK